MGRLRDPLGLRWLHLSKEQLSNHGGAIIVVNIPLDLAITQLRYGSASHGVTLACGLQVMQPPFESASRDPFATSPPPTDEQ